MRKAAPQEHSGSGPMYPLGLVGTAGEGWPPGCFGDASPSGPPSRRLETTQQCSLSSPQCSLLKWQPLQLFYFHYIMLIKSATSPEHTHGQSKELRRSIGTAPTTRAGQGGSSTDTLVQRVRWAAPGNLTWWPHATGRYSQSFSNNRVLCLQ